MKKNIFRNLLVIFTFCVFVLNVKAYDIYDKNNPGNSYTGSSNYSEATQWPYPSLNAIRITVRRNGSVIKDDWFSLANNSKECMGNVTARVCKNSGYNYGTVSSVNASCTSGEQNVIFKSCIVGSNLSSSFLLDANSSGTYLNNHLKNNGYSNLKGILKLMGYDETNFNNSDKIVVEPATYVRCANVGYFGTSTAMMKMNVSYSGSSGNKCAANDNTYNGYKGYTFQNVFRTMSKNFQINNPNKTCNKDNDFKGCGFFEYDVSSLNYKPAEPKYSLTINKKNKSTKGNINGVKFTLTGNGITYSCTTNINGTCTISNIPKGTYTVTESVPTGYDSSKVSCSGCQSVSGNTLKVSITGNKTIEVNNEKTCISEFEQYKNDRLERINLYKKYGFRGLLDFTNTTNASKACSNVTCNYSNSGSCLSGSSGNVNFSANNLSCYNEEFDNNGKKVYCLTTFNLTNKLNKSSFTSKSGQMFIKSSDLNSAVIANGTLSVRCYSTDSSFSQTKDYKNYIDKIEFNNLELLVLKNGALVKPSALEDTSFSLLYNNNTGLFEGYKTIDYYSIPVWAKNGSGKISYSACSDCKFLGYGFISNLTTKNKTNIPFKISFKSDNSAKLSISSYTNSCVYTPTSELITDKDNKNNLNLEYRSVESNNPFPGKSGSTRQMGSNWRIQSLDTDGDGDLDINDYNYLKDNVSTLNSKYDINKDNVIDELDLNIILEYTQTKKDLYASIVFDNTPNSFGYIKSNTTNTKVEPKYVITLTPSDIKKIKSETVNYNYDDYGLTCTNDGNTCISDYLTKLTTRNVTGYNDRKVLVINNSTKRK